MTQQVSPPSLQVSFTGTLSVAPASSGEGSIPAGASLIPYATNPDPKCLALSTGDQVANVSSPDSYVTLPLGSITQVTFLFLRTAGTMSVRTTTNGVGSPAVEVVNGMKVIEYDPGSYLTLLEVEGVGVVEYLAAGPM